VGVDVHDEHPSHSTEERERGSVRGIAEDAVPSGTVVAGMMPRRAYDCESVPSASRHNFLDGLDARASGAKRRIDRSGRKRGFMVESAGLAAQLEDTSDLSPRMHHERVFGLDEPSGGT